MHKSVIMFCDKTQSPALPFGGTHSKLHGVRGLRKHYNMILDPKIVHGTCAIHQIPCAFIRVHIC